MTRKKNESIGSAKRLTREWTRACNQANIYQAIVEACISRLDRDRVETLADDLAHERCELFSFLRILVDKWNESAKGNGSSHRRSWRKRSRTRTKDNIP